MSDAVRTKNKVVISGKWEYVGIKRTADGKVYYYGTIHSNRISDTVDHIPVYFDHECDEIKGLDGHVVKITGKFCSRDERDTAMHRHLILFVLAEKMCEYTGRDVNNISLKCFICRKPGKRETPLGKVICDLLVATNEDDNSSQYIPCIAWGRGATVLGNKGIGDLIEFDGRLQSRVYQKTYEDVIEERTAYEVSVSTASLFK